MLKMDFTSEFVTGAYHGMRTKTFRKQNNASI